ncbi:DNA ligase 1-like [Salvia splendens]|uniref:DNA ligase 1-like n=1 Tax=Salvia splendens TaxID=180675 RepID=UPI001C26C3DB|nr:DNA ligase 1-like [Salvia splendens]
MPGSSRSSFDLLMANASKKKNQPSKAKESSPPKRKSPSKPQSQTPDLLPQKEDTPENQDIVQNSSSCEIGGLKDSDSNPIQTSSSNADKGLVAAKKPKLSITPEESVSELKKKAVEFKANKENGCLSCFWQRRWRLSLRSQAGIAPAHEGLELGIWESSIIKELAEACGAKEAHIKKQYEVSMVPFSLLVMITTKKNSKAYAKLELDFLKLCLKNVLLD